MVKKPPKSSLTKGGSSSSRKKSSSKPFWQSTPFVVSLSAIVLSIILQIESVAVYVDTNLGTSLSRRSLQQQQQQQKPLLTMNEAADVWCSKNPGVCQEAPDHSEQKEQDEEEEEAAVEPVEPFQVMLINKSPYRVDVHWDDGKFGQVIATLEETNYQMQLNVYKNNKFFITRHGVKERLFDPNMNLPLQFVTNKIDQTFVIPSNAAPSSDPCQDRFDICKDYAAKGQCWESPGWMIVHCCHSCDKELDARHLIDGSVRCTKERMNITDPIWQPGDLNKLFTAWATDKQYEQYEPKVLMSPDGFGGTGGDGDGGDGDELRTTKVGPWIMTFDNFFSPEEAEALIEGGRMAGFDRSTNQGTVNAQGEMEMVTSTTRTSSNAWCQGGCEKLPLVRAVTERIERVTGIPKKNYEPFQILEYQDNQFYKMHHVRMRFVLFCFVCF